MIGVRQHPGERELLDRYYADAGEAAQAVRDHLSHCPRCADAYTTLAADLDRLASVGRLGTEPSQPPGSWDAQAGRIRRRLGVTVPSHGEALAQGPTPGRDLLPRLGVSRRWSVAAALGTAAAVALVTWAPWTPSSPPVIATAPEQDQVDDQLLQEIETLLERPLGTLGGDGSGWPGAAVPTLTAL